MSVVAIVGLTPGVAGAGTVPVEAAAAITPEAATAGDPAPVEAAAAITPEATAGDPAPVETVAGIVPDQVDPTDPNQPPVASDRSFDVVANTALAIDLSTGWSDPEGGLVTLQSATQGVSGGEVTCSEAGSCTYTPPDGFTGQDSFTYTVVDQDGMTGSGTVTLTVTAPNRAPEAPDRGLSVRMNTAGSIDLSTTWSDPDGGSLSLQSNSQGTNGGRVACSGSGSCTYTPPSGFAGSDSFTYTVADGEGLTDTGTVDVTVNRPPNRPPVAPSRGINVVMNTSTVLNLSSSWSDPDGDRVTLRSNSQGGRGGRVSCSSTGACTYTPPAGYSGSDSFSYTVADPGGLTATGRVSVTVNQPSNRAPTAVDDLIRTEVGQPGSVNVLRNDADPNGDSLTVSSIGQGPNGRAACSGGVCTFTPVARWSGVTSFVYTVVDRRGGSSEARVAVVVAKPDNRPPVALNDVARTAENKAVSIPVLANDRDPDAGDSITLGPAGKAAHGVADCRGRACTYTPAHDFVGTDSFTYTVVDATGIRDKAVVTIGVGVVPDNLPPQGFPDELTMLAGQSKSVDVLRNDKDPDRADKLRVTRATNPKNGRARCSSRRCTYRPDKGFVGVDTFEYTVSDGHGGKDTALVTARVELAKRTRGLTLIPPSPPPGGRTTATGAGCTPGGAVTVAVAGTGVASGRADPAGRFRIPVTVPDRAVGRYPATARCGDTVLRGPLDLALLTAAPAVHLSTLVMGLVLLLLLVLLRSQLPVLAPAIAGRRRRSTGAPPPA